MIPQNHPLDSLKTHYFINNRLSSVTLKADDGANVRHTLEGLYGVPERADPTLGMVRWRSERDGNIITYFNRQVKGVEIWYEPIPSEKSGL